MKKQSKIMSIMLMMFALFLIVPVVAGAHVTVQPDVSTTNAYEKYTVRVPVEKEINTTEIKLEVPKDVDLVSVLPMTGWDYQLEKNEKDKITAVVWKANNGGIKSGEFVEFSFIGANPSKPGEVSWKALQTYQDGSVVEWVGPAGSDEPASITKIQEGDSVKPHAESSHSEHKDSNKTEADNTSTNWLPIVLSVIAILLALISLLRKRK